MKVLFSPIGNSDPWRNDRDGAMLHIVRHYNLDKVVLYFTRTIWEGNENRKGHKIYEWEKIIQTVSPNTEVEIIIENVDNAQDYDVFKEKFHKYLKIIEDSYEDCEIILNVTSGTPQMESTLCLEYIVYPENKKCIQVSTPTKDSNAGIEYSNPKDKVEEFEIVNEVEKKSEKRCKEINILSFREAMIRSQILGLIDNYDYEGALNLVSNQKSFRNGKLLRKKLLSLTKQIKTHEVFPEINEKYRDDALIKSLFHYLLLNMRYNRLDVAETLIRVKSIAEFILKTYIEIHWPTLIIEKDGKPYLNDEDNLSFVYKYNLLLEKRKQNFDVSRILGLPAFIDILTILEPNSQLLKEVNAVNDINGLRNSIAHNLDTLNLDKNKNYKKIMLSVEAIKNMLHISFPEIEEEDYNYFEEKNKEFKELL
ncbi:type III-A CRISPR-associated CARF protein Csm6 [Staphylococcus epidermidis]|uniref:type III-A CRISPR-associated CARF protein Csm6 n=1 Tax=Staphylococcus epidermidis TaxID=1282 RepID=UPI003AAC5961